MLSIFNMTNEAVILELHGNQGEVINYKVANTLAVEKGALMEFSGAGFIKAGTDGGHFAGIAATEKVISDGQATLGVYTKGRFDLFVGQTTLGLYVTLSGANQVRKSTDAEISGALVMGRLIEDDVTTGTASEVMIGVYT